MSDYKDIVIDNDAIVNTAPEKLPEEPYNIPQGVRPELNPNPGYGIIVDGEGKTAPAIKTEFKEGERGTPIDVVTLAEEGFKCVRDIYNFINGIRIKGKTIEEYIDSEGGVTEQELIASLLPYTKKTEVAEQLKNKDIDVNGVTSKGIANTGNIGNIGDIAATGDVSGASLSIGTTNIKNLFVRIMSAPSSTTLTDEQIAEIRTGRFIDGTWTISTQNLINPVFFPAQESINKLYGICITPSSTGDYCKIQNYEINLSTKEISLSGALIDFRLNSIYLSNLFIKTKAWPQNPSNTGTFTLKMVNGTLTWVAE